MGENMKNTEKMFIAHAMVGKAFFYGTIMARDWENEEYAKKTIDFVKLSQDFMMEKNDVSFVKLAEIFMEIKKDFDEWCHEREDDEAMLFDNFQLIINSCYQNALEKEIDISKFMNMKNVVVKNEPV